jgi:hypothetical protein
MKVLIGTPTYTNAMRLETVASVKAQRTAGKWDWKVVDHNPSPAPDPRNVLASYQHLRGLFLAGPWDALLCVEHDMVLPPDALQRLWDTGAPVAYGVYLLRHGSLVLNACQYVGERNMGESFSLTKLRPQGVVRVSGVGFGCTLMRRDVVERIPFTDHGQAGQSPDVPFAQDCVHTGVTQVAHFGVLCGHIENGKVLMPFRDDQMAMRTLRMNVSLNALVGGKSLPLAKGCEYDMPAQDADHLRRGGYATAIEEANAPAGDTDTHVQAPATAGAQPGKRSIPKRKRVATKSPH